MSHDYDPGYGMSPSRLCAGNIPTRRFILELTFASNGAPFFTGAGWTVPHEC
jgi:hypothetical protein